MNSFTNTKAGRLRLEAVCKVVREGLGLGSIPYVYDYPKEANTSLAVAFIPEAGWSLWIKFYPKFWRLSLNDQLHTIVHEHIHVTMIPLMQTILISPDYKKDKVYKDRVYRADEIVTDHLVIPLFTYLQPQINRALKAA